jgi:spore coat protein CotH
MVTAFGTRVVSLVVGLLLSAAVTPGAAQAQTAANLFDPDGLGELRLHELRLFINERDLSLLREHYTDNTYYPADLHWGGLRVRNVGLRSRGFGSRNPHKLGLRIDLDRYTTGQTLLGLETLVLDNLWQDPSMVRESAAMALFARMGQPASREAFARVYINERYEGVYAMVEAVDADYLQRTFGDPSGVLFEYRWQGPYAFEDLGDDLAPYQSLWKAETHRLDPASVLHVPIREMARAVNEPVDSVWRMRVERYVDLPQVVTHAAIDAFLAERDGLLGEWGINNLYLYRPSGSSAHRILPWDRDHAFQEVDASVFGRLGNNRLLAGALAFADLRAVYLDALARCADLATRDQWLERTIVRSAALIEQAALEDVRKPYDDETHAFEVASLVAFARQRSRYVLAEVERERAR